MKEAPPPRELERSPAGRARPTRCDRAPAPTASGVPPPPPRYGTGPARVLPGGPGVIGHETPSPPVSPGESTSADQASRVPVLPARQSPGAEQGDGVKGRRLAPPAPVSSAPPPPVQASRALYGEAGRPGAGRRHRGGRWKAAPRPDRASPAPAPTEPASRIPARRGWRHRQGGGQGAGVTGSADAGPGSRTAPAPLVSACTARAVAPPPASRGKAAGPARCARAPSTQGAGVEHQYRGVGVSGKGDRRGANAGVEGTGAEAGRVRHHAQGAGVSGTGGASSPGRRHAAPAAPGSRAPAPAGAGVLAESTSDAGVSASSEEGTGVSGTSTRAGACPAQEAARIPASRAPARRPAPAAQHGERRGRARADQGRLGVEGRVTFGPGVLGNSARATGVEARGAVGLFAKGLSQAAFWTATS